MKIKKIVVDSSVIVKWLNSQDENYLQQADKILADCEAGKINLYAPGLAKYEVGNAILNKSMSLPQAKSSLSTLYSLPINFMELNEEEAIDTLNMTAILKITYYDGVFIELAKKIGGTLITDNPKHQRMVSKVEVISLKNYN